MDAKKFLQDKGIILKERENYEYEYKIGANGIVYNLSDLLEEYALIKTNEIMLMKNK
jgi:hypothetical protein